VITSPPYFWQRDYKVPGQIGLEPTIEEYVKAVCDVMDAVQRVLHHRGLLFLNLGDTYYSGKGKPRGKDRKHNGRRLDTLRAVDASGLGKPKKTLLGMPWRVALAMIDRGWTLRTPIIWRRENAIPEPNAADRPWRTYEHVFMFSKSRSYDFCRIALKEANIEDVWTVESQSQPGREHPAVFPPDLVGRCLAIGNPGRGPVLDPFAGTATVLRAALRLGSEADGIDLNLNYCREAVAAIMGG
jgi:DNA modification methylase